MANWKKAIFGNPFSKGSKEKAEDYQMDINDIVYGRPQIEKETLQAQKELAVKIFESRQEASDIISTELRKTYYKAMFLSLIHI